jgi:signal transduction histidine kinase
VAQRWPVDRELEFSTTPVRGTGGEFLGRLYVFRDVTEQREVERMRSELISFVSHELRTPLTNIRGYLDVVLDGELGDVPEEQRRFLEIARRNGERLTVIINDLLERSRLEAGKLRLAPAAVDLAAQIEGAAASVRPQLAAKGQSLTVAVPASLPPVWGDGGRITQILLNLLSNAHKYTPEGGAVAVGAAVDGAFVRTDVRDTGVGLTPEEQAQLFTRFYRAGNAATRAAGGTGLGLAITRQLVELHGGQMRVASAPGEGSVFSFTLPLAGPGGQPPAAPEASPAAPGPT